MRVRISLLLLALYSTKIISSIANNPNIIDRNWSNSTSNKKINNVIFNKKIICSLPVEQIEIDNCKDVFYTTIDVIFALLFI
jgi:hypothetical protein